MESSNSQQRTIYIIDDSESIGILLAAELSDLGYKTENFVTGLSGLDYTIENPPDVLLLDAVLPDIHGFDVCKKLRESPKTQLLPIILITSFLKSDEDVIRGLDYGANDYIEKPINLEILEARIRTQLRIKALQDQLNFQKEKLHDQMEEYKKLSNFKDELIGVVAHDLKSPLSNVSMLLEYFQETLKNKLDSTNNRLISNARKTVSSMFAFIDDILDMSAIEAGKLELKIRDVDPISFLETQKDKHFLVAQSKSIDLTIHDELSSEPRLKADPNRLSQVIDNLISNALKFSKAGCKIILGLEEKSEFFLFYVQDNGMGIKTEDKSKLFKKFERLSNKPTGNESSTGLGLVIVKKIVELHGGNVWMESEYGAGTTVFFSIPKDHS